MTNNYIDAKIFSDYCLQDEVLEPIIRNYFGTSRFSQLLKLLADRLEKQNYEPDDKIGLDMANLFIRRLGTQPHLGTFVGIPPMGFGGGGDVHLPPVIKKLREMAVVLSNAPSE